MADPVGMEVYPREAKSSSPEVEDYVYSGLWTNKNN